MRANPESNRKHREEARRLIAEAAKQPRNVSDPFFFGRVLSHYDNGLLNIEDIRKGEYQ